MITTHSAPRYVCTLFPPTHPPITFENVMVMTCHNNTALLVLSDGRKVHVSGTFVLVEVPHPPQAPAPTE